MRRTSPGGKRRSRTKAAERSRLVSQRAALARELAGSATTTVTLRLLEMIVEE